MSLHHNIHFRYISYIIVSLKLAKFNTISIICFVFTFLCLYHISITISQSVHENDPVGLFREGYSCFSYYLYFFYAIYFNLVFLYKLIYARVRFIFSLLYIKVTIINHRFLWTNFSILAFTTLVHNT